MSATLDFSPAPGAAPAGRRVLRHGLTEARLVFGRPVFGTAEARRVACVVAVPGGYRGQIELPPCRG